MLKGKVAVVTGGSRGIGRAIVLQLAELGADVALLYAGNRDAAERTRAEAEALGVKALSYQCAVEDEEQVKRTCVEIVSAFGRADILVNNAGITKDSLMLRMTGDDFARVLDVNLRGAFHCVKHLSRHLLKAPEGRILNITSVAGLSGNAGQANYAASKAGLIGLTKTVAKEYAARGLTCNAIAPGLIQTDMAEAVPEEALAKIKAAIPLGRVGTVEDVARLAAFLASPAAGYITGEVIRVDGGMAI
jgi:3-oxoacyl-[acyl-carrier protein] reductase